MKKVEVANLIASEVLKKGGRAFFVGGYVRDKLSNIESDDIDIEVYNINSLSLLKILQKLGKVNRVGEKFGIFHLEEYDIDIALPRIEKTVGKRHKDIEIKVIENLDYKTATIRRDFTINSMLCDIITGEIIDEYNGKSDLKNKTLKHIDNSFSLDPLRLFRACQFASRFDYKIDSETEKLCKKMDITCLSKERVESEMKKALLRSQKPSTFFCYLNKMGKLEYWFKEVYQLIGLKQDALYHPEGDVFVHTMEVLDRGAMLRDRAENSYYFMMLCLTHDFGKIITTTEENGRIHSFYHEDKGVSLVENFAKRISSDKNLVKYLKNLVPLHMKPNVMAKDNSSVKKTNQMFDRAISKKDLILFALADKKQNNNTELFLENRYKIYEETMNMPYVTGTDLINNGITDREKIKKYLAFSHTLRLAGEKKENILKQILSQEKNGK